MAISQRDGYGQGYGDIALSFSREAQYAGIPGADVTRGMLFGGGRAEYLEGMDTFFAGLDEEARQFDEALAEKIREFDIGAEFAEEKFEFYKEQFEYQKGMEQDYFEYLKGLGSGGKGGINVRDFLGDFGGGFDFGSPGYGGGPGTRPNLGGYPSGVISVGNPNAPYEATQNQVVPDAQPYPDFGGQYFQQEDEFDPGRFGEPSPDAELSSPDYGDIYGY